MLCAVVRRKQRGGGVAPRAKHHDAAMRRVHVEKQAIVERDLARAAVAHDAEEERRVGAVGAVGDELLGGARCAHALAVGSARRAVVRVRAMSARCRFTSPHVIAPSPSSSSAQHEMEVAQRDVPLPLDRRRVAAPGATSSVRYASLAECANAARRRRAQATSSNARCEAWLHPLCASFADQRVDRGIRELRPLDERDARRRPPRACAPRAPPRAGCARRRARAGARSCAAPRRAPRPGRRRDTRRKRASSRPKSSLPRCLYASNRAAIVQRNVAACGDLQRRMRERETQVRRVGLRVVARAARGPPCAPAVEQEIRVTDEQEVVAGRRPERAPVVRFGVAPRPSRSLAFGAQSLDPRGIARASAALGAMRASSAATLRLSGVEAEARAAREADGTAAVRPALRAALRRTRVVALHHVERGEREPRLRDRAGSARSPSRAARGPARTRGGTAGSSPA